MANRPTSKASLLDEKEKGHLISQEERVLEIMSIGGTFSRQEILALYRGKHGEIEYTSISRCCTNLKDDGKIFEVGTRKCSVTDKTINELSLVKNKYGYGEYQAWVEAGKTKKEQLARFKRVPEHMKKRVQSHMKTVIALKVIK